MTGKHMRRARPDLAPDTEPAMVSLGVVIVRDRPGPL